MANFKKNQRIVAILPTGREVEGYYIEQYSATGHSIYVQEFNGLDRNGEPVYKKVRYGVNEAFIKPYPKETGKASGMQYKSWLKRAMDLEARIKENEKELSTSNKIIEEEKLKKKIERFKTKLAEIEAKISDYEGK